MLRFRNMIDVNRYVTCCKNMTINTHTNPHPHIDDYEHFNLYLIATKCFDFHQLHFDALSQCKRKNTSKISWIPFSVTHTHTHSTDVATEIKKPL